MTPRRPNTPKTCPWGSCSSCSSAIGKGWEWFVGLAIGISPLVVIDIWIYCR